MPDASAPLKLITVIEEITLWETVAVTVTLESGADAKARQISDVPLCPLARTTSAHVRPPPVTPVTVVFVPPRKSVAMNARSNSLEEFVEKTGEATVVALAPSVDTFASTASTPEADAVCAVKLTPVALPTLRLRV